MRRSICDMEEEGSGQRFDDVWPDVARQVDAVLRSRGIDSSLREDLVQETAVRLLQAWHRLDLTRPIDGLAMTISLNLLRDHFRRRSNQEILGEVPEQPSELDVERLGMARSELHRVGKAMSKLSADHRMVLLSEVTDECAPGPRGPAALKMLRMRARRRLNSILETASSAAIGLSFRFRRDAWCEPAASVLAAAAIIIAAGPVVGGTQAGTSPTHASRPSTAIAVRSPVWEKPSPQPWSETRRGVNIATAAPLSPPAVSDSPPQRSLRPVSVPLPNGEATMAVRVQVGQASVGVGQYGGLVPICVSGVPHTPEPTQCPEDEKDATDEASHGESGSQ